MPNASISELHKAIVNGIWRNLTTFEILAELSNPRGLNINLSDSKEREMESLIIDLRRRVKEAQECGQEAAENAVRAGLDWRGVIEYLERPYLLPSGAVINFAHAAFEKIAAEKETT